MASSTTLLTLDEALAIVLAEAHDIVANHPAETRRATLWESSGLVLAEDIRADRDEPAFDKSMMDGFAVAAASVPADGASLPVVATLAAGSLLPFSEDFGLAPGEAAAIMTGAAIPRGADAVVVVERCTVAGDRVFIPGPVRPGANIIPRGAHVRAGEVVVESGRVVESLTAGVLGTVGAASFLIHRRPRVTVLATGDELVHVEETPRDGQIRDSNRRTLMALAEAEWGRVVDGGLVEDTRVALREAVAQGLDSDVLLISGGVSRGEFDLVHETLVEAGVDILFHRIAIKPGNPCSSGGAGGPSSSASPATPSAPG
jgi:molybdopterin molybdotransferase